MVFSGNVPRGVQEGIKELWGNSYVQQYEKYLGLPPIVGRSRANAFRSIKQRFWQKLQAWKEKLLSQGVKEVLLKAVALSIPSYSMSCFLLPSSLCAELEGMMARKASGGLGFKNLRVFNLAMLATQGWRLVKEENSLLHRLLKAKYFSGSDFLQARLGRSPSYTWRGIWEAKKWVLEGCRWMIGVGTAVNIWFDNWILGHNALVKEGLLNPLLRVIWKNIWKMPVPNKIKIFAWRACKDGLPMKGKLLGKQVPTDVRCNLCRAEPEGLYHALVQCVDVQKLWADYLPVLERDKFLNVFELAFHFWEKRQSQQEVRDVYKWKPPDHDVLKLNVDGAVFEDMGKAGTVAILRDSSCRVLMAASALEEAIAEPE
ncbi:hypothetical protein Patl1_15891 [Pistacia atlantica]|uniref:Uncharacterized protein n=1 Tax=Pistacia atlantica TaxID=434234 RepID=A0ACC1B881_9ROSI|nr:hypothetical protein Patl1_15891 [Pistacia atlantica]